MEKPEWKDAPIWADWLAMDADGKWYWYQSQPIARNGVWRYNESGEWDMNMLASPNADYYEAKMSLERRPS